MGAQSLYSLIRLRNKRNRLKSKFSYRPYHGQSTRHAISKYVNVGHFKFPFIHGYSAFFPIFGRRRNFLSEIPTLRTNKTEFHIFDRCRDCRHNDPIWLIAWGLRSEDMGGLSHSHDIDYRRIRIVQITNAINSHHYLGFKGSIIIIESITGVINLTRIFFT